jgi:hypothetical protein
MHAPSVLCRPSGHAADVRTNANTYTRGVEPLCSPCPTARTRARERARQRGRPSPCRRFAPPRCATPSLTAAQRACRPYHALVLVGRAVDAMIRMLALSSLVLPSRRHFVHRRGSLSPVQPATSSPRVDAGQDRSSPYPIRALASLLMLRVLLCPTTGTPTPVWGDVDTARGTAPPSRLLRPGLCPCRDCIAVLLAIAVVAEPPALTRANPVVAFPTSSETEASRSRPPRRSTSPRRRERLSA